MATDDVKEATEGVEALSVGENTSNGTTVKWGLELPHLYQLAVKFYKGEVTCSMASLTGYFVVGTFGYCPMLYALAS